MSDQTAVPWRSVLTGPNAGVFSVLSFGVWLHAADSTIVATLMPSVVNDIGGAPFISWNFVLYVLASIAAACCGAIVARRIGLRRAMIWAALAVGIGCAASALTPHMVGMLVGRTIQGAGGGLLVALTMIGASSLFPRHYTPRVMAAISAVWGASAFIGPLAGGIFAEYWDWRFGFWAFAAQAAAMAVALRCALPADAKADDLGAKIPWRRLSVLSGGVLAISVAGLEGENSFGVAGLCFVGLLGVVQFLRLDRAAADNRLLPRATGDMFGEAGSGFVGIFLVALATVPFTIYGPILLSILHDVGPIAAGYLVALESVAWTFGALIFSGASGVAQVRVVRWNFVAILAGSVGLAFFVTPGPIWALLPMLFLLGMGFGAAFGHILQRCVDLVPEDDKDRAAGAMPTIQTIGYAVGSAIIGLVANNAGFGDNPGLETAATAGYWVFAAMIPVALLAAVVIRRLPPAR